MGNGHTWVMGELEEVQVGADKIEAATLADADPDKVDLGKFWISASRGAVKWQWFGMTCLLSDEISIGKLKLKLKLPESK